MDYTEAACGEAIVVLGMHRSGTSATAGFLSMLGRAGPMTPLDPAPDNEKGYFESARIVEFNDRLLASVGSFVLDWRELDNGRLAELRSSELMRDAVRLIWEEFGETERIVLKDPRICRLMPFWGEAFRRAGYRISIVIPVRHPAEVAASLAARDATEHDRIMLVWLRHVLDAELASRGFRRVFFQMRDLIEDWRSCLATIVREISVPIDASDHQAAQIDAFLAPTLVHQRNDLAQPIIGKGPEAWALETYYGLVSLINDPREPAQLAVLDQIRTRFNEVCGVFTSVNIATDRELNSAMIARAEMARAAETANHRADEALRQLDAAEASAAELCTGHAAEIGDLAESTRSLQKEVAGGQKALAAARADRDQLTADLQKARGSIGALEQAVDLATQTARTAVADRDRASGARDAERTRHDAALARSIELERSNAESLLSHAHELKFWRDGTEQWQALTEEKTAFIDMLLPELRHLEGKMGLATEHRERDAQRLRELNDHIIFLEQLLADEQRARAKESLTSDQIRQDLRASAAEIEEATRRLDRERNVVAELMRTAVALTADRDALLARLGRTLMARVSAFFARLAHKSPK